MPSIDNALEKNLFLIKFFVYFSQIGDGGGGSGSSKVGTQYI